jgi:UDP-N-acetylglucosamine 2-epimerase (non-hydrolysing)
VKGVHWVPRDVSYVSTGKILKIITVVGARPNFIKLAPIIKAMNGYPDRIEHIIVHTGQHYAEELSKSFFDDLDIKEPSMYLGVGSGTHAEQTAYIMVEFEKVCLIEKPKLVIVFGDVNSTLACSITAKKLRIKVAHVEAGLRSWDMTMPEEINRIVTDSLSDYLFTTEKSGIENLKNEGRREQDIFFVGNLMIDTLHLQLSKIENCNNATRYEIDAKKKDGPFAVVTLHRPSNVDDQSTLAGILEALILISEDMPIVFPVHPRTRKNIEEFDHLNLIKRSNVELLPPMPYTNFLKLWKDASLVLTDSGGLQEETTALGIPCFTIRDNTERPVTIKEGTNTLVGTTRGSILSAYEKFKNKGPKKGKVPKYWDGKAAQRILDILISSFED